MTRRLWRGEVPDRRIERRRAGHRGGAVLLAFVLTAGTVLGSSMSAQAVTSQELRRQRERTQQQLDQTSGEIEELSEEQQRMQAEMEATRDTIAQTMASIALMEEQIQETDLEIQLRETQYAEARQSEQEQYTAMKKRIEFMYRKGDMSYAQILLISSSFGDALNKSEYIDKLYDYDRRLLEQYQETRDTVARAKMELEDIRSEQETARNELQAEKEALDARVADLQATYADYADLIEEARASAAELKAQIQEQTAAISAAVEAEARAAEEARRKAEEEARRRAEQAAANGEGSGESASTQKTYAPPSTTKNGQAVVNYACQFVGNPYVYGGTSLTNGTDCSGFTMSVYKAFGVNLPRTAESQRGAGVAVNSLAEALPGDLICYPGHVALYVGNGTIVHASTAATGIKYSIATYRPIVCIRRVID